MFVQRIAEGHLLALIRHAECTLHQLHLAGLQLDYALLNRVLHDKSSHRHASLLADTVDPVYSLLLNGGVPPAPILLSKLGSRHSTH